MSGKSWRSSSLTWSARRVAELVQDGRVGLRVDGERVGARADVDVVAQRSRDERMVGITVVRVRGQQDLFLEPKMLAAVLLPVVHERRAPVARGVGGRAFERPGDVERQVVVVRERDEGGVALHRPQIRAWPSARGTRGADPGAHGCARRHARGRRRCHDLSDSPAAAACATASSASSPRSSMRQPAASGSRGTKPASRVWGAMASSRPRVMPRCKVHTTGWLSRTTSRYGQLHNLYVERSRGIDLALGLKTKRDERGAHLLLG